MGNTADRAIAPLPIRVILRFVLHQLVATLVVMVAAPLLLAVLAPFLRLVGVSLYMRQFHWILTETPYFPVQVTLALILGYFLRRRIGDRSMAWVWVLPFVILSWALVTNAHVLDWGSGASARARFPRFFGWGCRPADHCLDQLMITLPFYTSLAYSFGAWLARGRPTRANGTMKATSADLHP
jgi:hypothetical protein